MMFCSLFFLNISLILYFWQSFFLRHFLFSWFSNSMINLHFFAQQKLLPISLQFIQKVYENRIYFHSSIFWSKIIEEASEPNWVNSIYDIIWVNSLRLGSFHIQNLMSKNITSLCLNVFEFFIFYKKV